jgi:hypothetical protein
MTNPIRGARLTACTTAPRKPPAPRSRLVSLIAALAASTLLVACGLLRPHQAPQAPVPPARTATPAAGPASGLALLPVSPAGLAAAAALAVRFAASYASYRYDQPPASHLATLRPMATAGLYAALASGAQAPGLQAQRAGSHLAVTARAQPEQIRDIQPGAVIIAVQVQQDTDSTADRTQSTVSYAVTVIAQDGAWRVYDIEPAAAGNQGGAPG